MCFRKRVSPHFSFVVPASHFVSWELATRCWLSAIALVCVLSQGVASAVTASPHPFDVTQPDGSSITLRIKGDERYHWMEDSQGYTVVKAQNRYVYATVDAAGALTPTNLEVGKVAPGAAGLQPGVQPSPAIRSGLVARSLPAMTNAPRPIAPQGTLKNLVIPIRFANHGSRTLPSTANLNTLFNAVGGAPILAPTGSVRDVYTENSYGQMTLDSIINNWVTVSGTEQFYADGQSGLSTSIWGALTEALDQADATVNFDDYDSDNDGYIDVITFLHSGYGAEWGGTDQFGTDSADRIWSHRWSMTDFTSNEGVKVSAYHISPAVWDTSGSDIGRIGVIAHEMGHFFELPDLYDYDDDIGGAGAGLGSWCMMANSWGFDGSQLHPPHFSPWCKISLGWVVPTTIVSPGIYSVAPSATEPEIFKVSANYASGEYLLIENRQPLGFETIIPGDGLMVYHIDEAGDFNIQGYPGQSGWPQNGLHYRVALLQADGEYGLEQNFSYGDAGDPYNEAGVNALTPSTVPNTNGYKGGTITVTGHSLTNVVQVGDNMQFSFNQGACDFSLSSSSLDVGIEGTNSGRFDVSVASSCQWIAGPSAPWIAIISPTLATSGNRQVKFSVAPNEGAARSGSIIVGNEIFHISQEGDGESTDNDDFSGRVSIVADFGIEFASNQGASEEPGEPDHYFNPGGRSLWWSFIAPGEGTMMFNTNGSYFDTLLGVYTGSSVGALTEITSDDDSGIDVLSLVFFATVPGMEYQIAVDGYWGDFGDIVLSWEFTPDSVDPPFNDDFANAGLLPHAEGILTAVNGLATLEAGEPNHAGDAGAASLWWTFTAPSDGLMAIDTIGSNFDTLLAVYTGAAVNSLAEVASNDDDVFFTPQSYVSFPVTGGADYRIAVDGSGGATGTVSLGWYFSPVPQPPANDDFLDAYVLPGPEVGILGTTALATKETNEPNHSGNSGGASAWWAITLGSAQDLEISTAGSDFDTVLGVYTGSSVDALSEVASNDDSHSTVASSVTFAADAGVTYYIAVDGYDGAYGDVVLSVASPDADPANNYFADAIALNYPEDTAFGSNMGATWESGEPYHAGTGGGASVWWTLETPADQDVDINTLGSDFDTVLAVYTGSYVDGLTEVARDDDSAKSLQSSVSFSATAGVTYYIAVDGYGGDTGSISLNYFETPPVPVAEWPVAVALGAVAVGVLGWAGRRKRGRG